ncbi:uncharacterized protein G2W53_041879 [Senna tora]|uniref:Uncharacterized protein n=1 Tax=Senna tora TaxID=362788 RepID=A0A834SI54_9FABA|nr:uncharacterized protein G2W53_041879 [Senna tora]
MAEDLNFKGRSQHHLGEFE